MYKLLAILAYFAILVIMGALVWVAWELLAVMLFGMTSLSFLQAAGVGIGLSILVSFLK